MSGEAGRGGGPNRRRGGGRGRGGYGGPGRDNYGFRRGGMHPVNANRIPPVPRTPLDDPFKLPFPRLLEQSTKCALMTKDEELLREILGLFNLRSAGSLEFEQIYNEILAACPDLIDCVYNSKEHLWAYIRCYPDQFSIDQDPRYPWKIWYSSLSKIVAKADRRRYQREYVAGNIRIPVDVERKWNEIRFDPRLEQMTVTYLYALFQQLDKLRPQGASEVNVTKIALVCHPDRGFPVEIFKYAGMMDDFIHRRMHFFNMFGCMVSVRQPEYTDAFRLLAKRLLERNSSCDPKDLYEFFIHTPLISAATRASMNRGNENVLYDDFLFILDMHKMLFRMRMRDGVVELRHGVVPIINQADIDRIEPFPGLEDCFEQEHFDFESEGSVAGFVQAQSQRPTEMRKSGSEDDDYLYDGYEYDDVSIPSVTKPTNSNAATTGRGNGAGINHIPKTETGGTSKPAQVLASCQRFLPAQRVNGTGLVGNAIAAAVSVTQNDEQMFISQNAPPSPPRRMPFRIGARPPRASVRCRPPPTFQRPVQTIGEMPVTLISAQQFEELLESEIGD